MIREQDIHVEYVANHEINDHSLTHYLKKPTFNPKACLYLQVSCMFIYSSCYLFTVSHCHVDPLEAGSLSFMFIMVSPGPGSRETLSKNELMYKWLRE